MHSLDLWWFFLFLFILHDVTEYDSSAMKGFSTLVPLSPGFSPATNPSALWYFKSLKWYLLYFTCCERTSLLSNATPQGEGETFFTKNEIISFSLTLSFECELFSCNDFFSFCWPKGERQRFGSRLLTPQKAETLSDTAQNSYAVHRQFPICPVHLLQFL